MHTVKKIYFTPDVMKAQCLWDVATKINIKYRSGINKNLNSSLPFGKACPRTSLPKKLKKKQTKTIFE